MTVRLYSINVDSRDPHKLGRWWMEALGYQVLYEAPDEFEIGPDRAAISLTFVPVPESKTVKNRLHIDLAPDDQHVEVERFLKLGATHADIGQGDEVPWVVLRDPEGNEFCVLTPR